MQWGPVFSSVNQCLPSHIPGTRAVTGHGLLNGILTKLSLWEEVSRAPILDRGLSTPRGPAAVILNLPREVAPTGNGAAHLQTEQRWHARGGHRPHGSEFPRRASLRLACHLAG
jgi:hypothetical protein